MEEIITETTREVELSETEETESDRSSSDGACGDKGKSSTDREADVAEVEVTTEEEDAAESEEEAGPLSAEDMDDAATGEEGEADGAEMETQSLPDAEEHTDDKWPPAILRDQSTETEDMADRTEVATGSTAEDTGETFMEKTQGYRSVGTLKAEQLLSQHEAEEKREGYQTGESSGLLETDFIEPSQPVGHTQDKLQEQDEMFKEGKELSRIEKTPEKETYGLMKVKGSMQLVADILGPGDKEKKALDVEVNPESLEKDIVDPGKLPEQSLSKLACSLKCEPDAPFLTIAVPKDTTKNGLGRPVQIRGHKHSNINPKRYIQNETRLC